MDSNSPSRGVFRASPGQLVKRHARACHPCATAKAKCILEKVSSGSTTNECERCSRMKLECRPQPAVLRKRRELKAVRLEQKLDNIVSLLSHSGTDLTLPPLAPQSISILPAFKTHPGIPTSNDISFRTDHQPILPTPPNSYEYGGSPSTTVHQLSAPIPLLDLELTRDEEESRLNIFRERMTQYFPFVVVLSNLSAQMMSHEKPFFLATIMLAASNRAISYQNRVGRRLMEYMCVHLILNGEKSLDLLQGILVYITWCHHRYQNNPRISYLMQLAISLAIELGIDKSPASSSKQTSLIDSTKGFCADVGPSHPHSTDEMRAFLGVYYLSSVTSSSLKKLEPLSYSTYAADCCQALSTAAEYSTDRILVQLVHIQHFHQQIGQALPIERLEAIWDAKTPVVMFVDALASEIEKFKGNLPPELHQNVTLFAHYHRVWILLYEIALAEPSIESEEPMFPRIKLLYCCLTSVKTFLEAFFRIPPEEYIHLSFVTWAELANVLIVIARLHLLKLEGWSLEFVRSSIDFFNVLEKLSQNFEAGSRCGEANEEENNFLQFSRMMKWAMSSYNQRLNVETRVTQTAQHPQMFAQVPGMSPEHMMSDYISPDDMFWQEFIGEWGTNS